jgi:hypothetical protein
MEKVISLHKRIPLDLGQGSVADTTRGKRIALSRICDSFMGELL